MRNLEKEQEFKQWLKENRYDDRTIDSRITNCKKVNEKYDLYEYFTKGNTQEIYKLFTYTTKDMNNGLKPLHNIPINGNPYTGTHTYKYAIKLYFAFLASYEIENKRVDLSGIHIFKEEEYKTFLAKKIKSVDDYINYVKNVYKLLGSELFPIIEEIYQLRTLQLLQNLKEGSEKYLSSTFKNVTSISKYISGFKKYLDFIEEIIYNDFDTISDPDIDDETELLEEEEVEKLFFIPKKSHLYEEIRENFFKRLTNQNRFNKRSDFYFPISFLQQYFYKTDDKQYFDNIINQQIEGIQFFYNKGTLCDEVRNLKELSISEEGQVFINGNMIFSQSPKNNNAYIPFEVVDLSEIDIDHRISMSKILKGLKGENYPQLVKITNALNENIRKRENKKLAKKGTILSDNVEFRNSIIKAKLKEEFENIVSKMELQLMQDTHNNQKRDKTI
jgi:hypothetical protein